MRKERNTYIGGHQIAAIMGMHPFQSAVDVWQQIVKKNSEDIGEKPAVRRGRILEPGFLDWIEENHVENGSLFRRDFFVSGPEEFFGGTIDAAELNENERPRHLHEVTTTTSWSLDSWGADGDPDGASLYKWVQAQWYMGITGAASADIWLFVADTGEIRRYPIKRSDESIAAMQEQGKEWWNKHVVLGFEPDLSELDGKSLASMSSSLDKMYDADPSKTIEATSEIINLAYDYTLNRKQADSADELKKATSAKLKVLMKDATKCKWDGGSVSWTQNKSSEKVDYKSAIEQLAGEGHISLEVMNKVIEDNTSLKPGPRVLRVTIKGEK
jgi:predicted phage-related endonuclease